MYKPEWLPHTSICEILFYQNLELSGLVVQWLRRHAPNAGRSGPIPGQGTRCHVLQLRSSTVK